MKGIHYDLRAHHIYIKHDAQPVRQPQCRINLILRDTFKQELKKKLSVVFI